MEIVDFGDFQPGKKKAKKTTKKKPVLREMKKAKKPVIRETENELCDLHADVSEPQEIDTVIREMENRNTIFSSWEKKMDKLDTFQSEFESFKIEIQNQLASLQSIDIPDSIMDALTTILKESHKRYKKWNYTGYLGHAKTVIKFFNINLK